MLKGAQLPFEHIYSGKSSTEINFYIPNLNERVKVAHALNRLIAKKKCCHSSLSPSPTRSPLSPGVSLLSSDCTRDANARNTQTIVATVCAATAELEIMKGD